MRQRAREIAARAGNRLGLPMMRSEGELLSLAAVHSSSPSWPDERRARLRRTVKCRPCGCGEVSEGARSGKDSASSYVTCRESVSPSSPIFSCVTTACIGSCALRPQVSRQRERPGLPSLIASQVSGEQVTHLWGLRHSCSAASDAAFSDSPILQATASGPAHSYCPRRGASSAIRASTGFHRGFGSRCG